jgi:hypothetical protein
MVASAVVAVLALALWYFGRAQTTEVKDLAASVQRTRGILAEDAGLADLSPLEEQRDRLKERAAVVGLPKVNSGEFSFELSSRAREHGVTINSLEYKPEEVTIAITTSGGQVSAPIQRYSVVASGPAGGLRAFTSSMLATTAKPRIESFQANRPPGSSSWVANFSLVVYGEEGANP